MANPKVHYPLVGLRIDPDVLEQLEIDEKAVQTLAALFGWDGTARRMLTCSGQGSLNAVSPPVSGIENEVSSGPAEDITFDDVSVTEIMILANPKNTGDVWVNVKAAAAIDTGWPLEPGDIAILSINNMQDLKLHVITTGDKIIIVRAG